MVGDRTLARPAGKFAGEYAAYKSVETVGSLCGNSLHSEFAMTSMSFIELARAVSQISAEVDLSTRKDISLLQDDVLFTLRLHKLSKLKDIAAQTPFDSGWRLIAPRLWAPLLDEVEWGKFEYIEDDFFADLSGDAVNRKIEFLNKAILVCSNYPPQYGQRPTEVIKTLANFTTLYLLCPNTLFLGWDWDNHFLVHIGATLAAGSDIYFPSHLANDYELSCFCSHKYHTPAGSHQWGGDFLRANLRLITRADRIHDVFGRFKKYRVFGFRTRVISTLSNNLKHVSQADDLSEYHSRSAGDKLEEWTRFKCHWIVPTLNDVSTRVFDALITGGVIIVPERFRSAPILSDLDERDCFFHTEVDIIEPAEIVQKALSSFDACGTEGVLRRHRLALTSHNLDSRVKSILDTAKTVLERVAAQ